MLSANGDDPPMVGVGGNGAAADGAPGNARNDGGGGDAPCDGAARRACTRCAPRSKMREAALGSVREGVESRV